jgi:steroid delta-isomerase-like uncharacterized protein
VSLDENKTLVRKFHEAFANGGLGKVAEFLSPDLKSYSAGSSVPASKADYLAGAALFQRAFPDSDEVVLDQLAEGDRVVTRGVFTGTHLGPFKGFPATGNKIEFSWMTIDRIVDGLIAEHRVEQDNVALLRQVGAIPS